MSTNGRPPIKPNKYGALAALVIIGPVLASVIVFILVGWQAALVVVSGSWLVALVGAVITTLMEQD